MTVPSGPADGPATPEPKDAAEVTTAGLQTAAMHASWWTAVQAVIGLPLSVAVNLIMARSLGPHGYGLLASYMTAFGLILTVLNAGISDASIQWGAAAHARADRTELIEICRRCAGYHIFVEAPLASLAVVVVLHQESVAVQVVGACAAGITMLVGTTVVVLTAISMNAPLAKLNIVVGLGVQLAVVTAAVQTHAAGPTWVARLALAMLAPLGALLFAPRDIRRASFMPLAPRAWPTGFARYSRRTLMAGLVTTLVFSRSEILVLDAYGDAAAAGLFALAAGLAVQITAPIDAMLGPLIPAAASLLAVGRERAGAAVLRGIRLSALATAPLALIAVPAIAVLAPAVYGHRFASSGALFVSLGLVSCIQSVLHPVTAFLGALRKPLLVLGLNLIALITDLALVIALVPVLGATGAVIGNSAGQIASLGASTWMLNRHLRSSTRQTIKALMPFGFVVLSVTVGSVAGLLAQSDDVPIWLCSALAVSVAALGGVITIRAVGGIVTSDDLVAIESGFPRARWLVTGVRAIGFAIHHAG